MSVRFSSPAGSGLVRPIIPFFLLLSLIVFSGCGSSGGSASPEHELRLTSLSGESDTVEFHIGSPLFLRIEGSPGRGCEPENGDFFIFGPRDAQLGWGLREVADPVAFPSGDCVRYLMLPAVESNGLAEGYYTASVALLLDEKSRRTSDTIVLHPIHAASASTDSYAQFLLAQLVESSPMLRNETTVAGLFADHLPQDDRTKLYEALIRYRIGDLSGAREAFSALPAEPEIDSGPHVVALWEVLDRLLAGE